MVNHAAQHLLTDRLVLRPFQADDADEYARIRAKPEVVRYLPGGEASAEAAQSISSRVIKIFDLHWREHGFGPWAVIDAASSRLIGHLGLRVVPELGGEIELLYMLDQPFWGKGLATEGCRAALDSGFRQQELDHVIALAMPENKASLAVMKRLGFADEGIVSAFNLQVVRCSLPADRWLMGESSNGSSAQD